MKEIAVSIIATGEELIRGEVQDTNSLFIAQELYEVGGKVKTIAAVSDGKADIVRVIKQALEVADLVIISGGLGPTSDDVTRDAVAEVVGKGLILNEDSLLRLQSYLEQKGRIVSENNKRQAYFPEGAVVFENRFGTADAFRVEVESGTKQIVSLPGVPREMKPLLSEVIVPWLEVAYDLKPYPSVKFKTFGLSESYIGKVIESCALSPSIYVSYRVHFPEILLTFTEREEQNEFKAKEKLYQCVDQVRTALKEEHIIAFDHTPTIGEVVGEILSGKNLTFALAESCTGGQCSSLVVDAPGASKYFLGSFVTYSNELKQSVLGVALKTLEEQGAVSKETAEEMASGVKKKSGADVTLAITGIAGPTGGNDQKPIGTVWISVAYKNTVDSVTYIYQADRKMFRNYISYLALDLVRRKLLGYPLELERL